MSPSNIGKECGPHVLVSVAHERYAFPLDAVQEILPAPTLFCPPGMPRLLEGFMDLAGAAIPVVSLARLFGLAEPAAALYTPLILLRDAPVPIAIQVEKALGILTADRIGRVQLAAGGASGDCATGIAMVDGHAVVLLSPERVLLRQERRRIADLQALEQTRLDAIREATA